MPAQASKLHQEKPFEDDIVAKLVSLGHLHTRDNSGYDKRAAIYTEDLIEFIKTTQPKEWEQLKALHNGTTEQIVIKRVTEALEKQGLIEVLQRGINIVGSGMRGSVNLKLIQFTPNHGLNPEIQKRLQANRFRVARQLQYSLHNRNSIDLVMFINGLPWATTELKTWFTQTVEDAMHQYRVDRQVGKGLKEEPLLKPMRGACVHLAVSTDKVRMTTELCGENTSFLPLDQGTLDGGAGNPINDGGYPCNHIWNDLMTKESILELLGDFITINEKMIADGNKKRRIKRLIFPRWHQRRAVKKILDHARENGAGQRYLVQHSAGSGKTNTIAWLALGLQQLHSPQGERRFDAVIVVSDRNKLDDQLQKTISSFTDEYGTVARIRGIGGSKKRDLAKALIERAPIIVTTQQSFPALLEMIEKIQNGEKIEISGLSETQIGTLADLGQRRYAIIADEAHGSQSGSSARKRDQVLSSDDSEVGDGMEILVNQMHVRHPNLSFVALTATPKPRTMEIFGTVTGSENGKTIREPFDTYSMRQAIEEGFILDVLKGYTHYETAWRLNIKGQKEKYVDEKKASRGIIQWVQLSKDSVEQRSRVILEHYQRNVSHLLGGQARAMVVTSSRLMAVRYHQELLRQIKSNKSNLQVMVAFTGEVEDPKGIKQTEYTLNPELQSKGQDVAEIFGEEGHHVLVVANKYTTGYDEPRLCAMYLDRQVSGVATVQTLSRLNRVYPGKHQTYVLDFANQPEQILKDFQRYYAGATLQGDTDISAIFDLAHELDAMGIYNRADIERFWETRLSAKRQEELVVALAPCLQRWQDHMNDAKERQDQERVEDLRRWRQNGISFTRQLDFIYSLHDLADENLEKRSLLLKALLQKLNETGNKEKLDMSMLELERFEMYAHPQELALGTEGANAMAPVLATGSSLEDMHEVLLQEVIEKLNAVFDNKLDNVGSYATNVMLRVMQNDKIRQQALANEADQFRHGTILSEARNAIVSSRKDDVTASKTLLSDNDRLRDFVDIISDIVWKAFQRQLQS